MTRPCRIGRLSLVPTCRRILRSAEAPRATAMISSYRGLLRPHRHRSDRGDHWCDGQSHRGCGLRHAIAFYRVAAARGARVMVPPAKTATALGRGPRSRARDRTIRIVAEIGRRQWQEASGYHRQARAENVFFRCTNRSSGVLFELAVQEARWPRHSSQAGPTETS
jgi:hypothetical protein